MVVASVMEDVTAPRLPPKTLQFAAHDKPEELYGVGLVFRTTRDGKLVVSSFIRDSSAFDCGLVRDGGKAQRPYHFPKTQKLAPFQDPFRNQARLGNVARMMSRVNERP